MLYIEKESIGGCLLPRLFDKEYELVRDTHFGVDNKINNSMSAEMKKFRN